MRGINIGAQTDAADSIGRKINSYVSDTVQVTPSVAVIDPQAHTVSIKLVNFGDDTVKAMLKVQAWVPTSGPDSSKPARSLATWLQDVPKAITLAPSEERTLTLHLAVPRTVQTGVYAAQLVIDPMPVGYKVDSQGRISFLLGDDSWLEFTELTSVDGKPAPPRQRVVKVEYQVPAASGASRAR